MSGPRRELFIADTSFVSVRDSPAAEGWPPEIVERIRAGHLGLSVVTIAELESGRLGRNWGQRRCLEQDMRLADSPHFSIGERTAHAYAELEVAEQREGRTFSENDLWIAATAQTLGVPLVTCDRAFGRMEHLDVEVVYLPAKAAVAVSATR